MFTWVWTGSFWLVLNACDHALFFWPMFLPLKKKNPRGIKIKCTKLDTAANSIAHTSFFSTFFFSSNNSIWSLTDFVQVCITHGLPLAQIFIHKWYAALNLQYKERLLLYFASVNISIRHALFWFISVLTCSTMFFRSFILIFEQSPFFSLIIDQQAILSLTLHHFCSYWGLIALKH